MTQEQMEEVKKILDQHYGESPDGMGNAYIAKRIYQLFPKPDEGRLLREEELAKIAHTIPEGFTGRAGLAIAKAQLAKDQEYESTILEPQCQARVEKEVGDYCHRELEHATKMKTVIKPSGTEYSHNEDVIIATLKRVLHKCAYLKKGVLPK